MVLHSGFRERLLGRRGHKGDIWVVRRVGFGVWFSVLGSGSRPLRGHTGKP